MVLTLKNMSNCHNMYHQDFYLVLEEPFIAIELKNICFHKSEPKGFASVIRD